MSGSRGDLKISSDDLEIPISDFEITIFYLEISVWLSGDPDFLCISTSRGNIGCPNPATVICIWDTKKNSFGVDLGLQITIILYTIT